MRITIVGLLVAGMLIALALATSGDPDRQAPVARERCAAAGDAPHPLAAAWLLNGFPVSCFAYGRPSDLRCAGPVHPTDSALGKVRSATLRLINRERRQRGLSRLAHSAKLRKAAASHSGHMLRGLFFSHRDARDSNVEDRVERTGYLSGSETWRLGENIAWGAGPRATPTRVVGAWMHSPPHRAAMLDPHYRHAGIGVVRGAPRGRKGCAATYTAVFGRL